MLPKFCIFINIINITQVYPTAASSLEILNVALEMSEIPSLITAQCEKRKTYIRVQHEVVQTDLSFDLIKFINTKYMDKHNIVQDQLKAEFL